MVSRLSTFSFKEIPWAGLVAMLCILVFEHGVYQPEWDLRAGRIFSNKLVAAKLLWLEQAPPAEFVFLGDSTVTTQINAGYLTENSSLRGQSHRFVNLGLVGSASVLGSSFLLERYLENHPPPKFVVLSYSPLTLSQGASASEERLSRFFHRPEELRELSELDVDVAARSLLRALVPSSMWNSFFSKFPRKNLKSVEEVRGHWREAERVLTSVRRDRGFCGVTEQQRFERRDWRVHLNSWNREALKTLVTRLKALDARVYFFFPPVPRTVYQEIQGSQEILQNHQIFIGEMESLGAEILPFPRQLPDEWFGSVYHLSEKNTTPYNERIIEELVRAGLF